MSDMKIVINPRNGRLKRVELETPAQDTEEEQYLFLVYQALAEEIQQFVKRTSFKVQTGKMLGELGEINLKFKDSEAPSLALMKV